MFPITVGKKLRCALGNPEPCSPKVTCIGQVRVKTKKKHGRKLRTLSVGNGDVGNLQQKINQPWGHFPLTICGADFSRLFPGRSSSSSSFSGGENSRQTSSCMAVFERWFVRIERDKTWFNKRCEKPDINAQPLEEGRVSICITPPKNALLMMRYRSDPVKMAALSSRLFENRPEEEENGIHHQDGDEAKKNRASVDVMKKEEDDNGYSSQANTHLEGDGRKGHDHSLLFNLEEKEQRLEHSGEKQSSKKPAGDSSSSSSALPDCLLLMICEPKLSMEVSKETWVCSTDFDRRLPERRRPDSEQKKRGSVLQPSRSSCTLPPPGMSMAAMIEQKLVNAVAYEPFVLTRCKSVPMKTVFFKY